MSAQSISSSTTYLGTTIQGEARNPPIYPFLRRVIRFLRQEDAPLVTEIKKIAKENFGNSAHKITKVLEAINSIDYSPLKHDLRMIIEKMTNDERKSLLSEALRLDFMTDQKFFGHQCLNLITLEELRSLAQDLSIKDTAEAFSKIAQISKKYNVEETNLKLAANSKEFFLLRLIKNFIRTIAVACNLLELGKEPNTYFETKYMLDIYWRLIEIPVLIIRFVLAVIINPLISLVVLSVGTTVSAFALHIFNKWFNRCPEQLPYCKNLTAGILDGTVIPTFGREKELEEILGVLAANHEKSRKHPLIIGEQGIGKTEMMNELAWRLVKGSVPDSLKGKKLFILNCAELMKQTSGFALKDPLEEIMGKVGEHQGELIIIFDEADSLIDTLGTRFNTILDTSKGSLFYAIGITTPAYYKKIESTGIDRRFQKFHMEEASKEQTLTILRHIHQQEAPDIKIPKKVFDTIYKQTKDKIKHRFQPDKAVIVMSQALRNVRDLQEGRGLEMELRNHEATNKESASKLSRKKLNVTSVNNQKIQDITQKISGTEAKIKELKEKIEQKRKAFSEYTNLKKLREWHHHWLLTTSEKIDQEIKKDREIDALLEKIYLFNSFILIPELDAYLSDFVVKNDLKVKVEEETISQIVEKLSKEKIGEIHEDNSAGSKEL